MDSLGRERVPRLEVGPARVLELDRAREGRHGRGAVGFGRRARGVEDVGEEAEGRPLRLEEGRRGREEEGKGSAGLAVGRGYISFGPL